MKDLLRAQGFNDTQIGEMRNFTARNVANLTALNLTQAHDKLGSAYVQAVRDSANTSLLVLENSMFFNREANSTGPPGLEELVLLDGLRDGTETALSARNWSALGPAARDLASAFFGASLSTGLPLFADHYRNATLAWAAAEIALSGDDGTAASMA